MQREVPRILFQSVFPGGTHAGGQSHAYAVSPDGQRFLIPQFENVAAGFGRGAGGGFNAAIVFAVPSVSADRRAATSTNSSSTAPITVVLNWTQMMKQQKIGTTMSLEPGTRLGPYEVLATISTGSQAGAGSDERYKASDTRLNRVVALKVLSPEFSEHPEMKARLESDARTISSLNHPNICALIEVGEAATGHEPPVTARFLVSEYVEGETLAQRLARGPLELQDALNAGHRDGRFAGQGAPAGRRARQG